MKLVGLALAILLAVGGDARATPRDDLASPSQETRDAAAETLRKTFRRAPRSKFTRLVKALKRPGMTKPLALAKLEPYHPMSEGAGAGGGGETILYRIDDGWILECAFSTRGDAKVLAVRLIDSTRHVWVEPPKDFTGVWTTYYVNGHPGHAITYKTGKYDGTNTSFHDDGSKAVVQTYGPDGVDGEDIGYHPNGKVAYRGTYKAGVQVGTWTWYDATGTVTSTRQH